MLPYSGSNLTTGTTVDEATFDISPSDGADVFTCDFSTLVIASTSILATLTIDLGTAYVSWCEYSYCAYYIT